MEPSPVSLTSASLPSASLPSASLTSGSLASGAPCSRRCRAACPGFPAIAGLLAFLAFGLLVASPLTAQEAGEDDSALTYQVPHPDLVKVVDAPMAPIAEVDPSGRWLLVFRRPGLPDLAQLARRELRLGGMRFHPDTWSESRGWTSSDLSLVPIPKPGEALEDPPGYERPVLGLPDGAELSSSQWSPDGERAVLTVQTGEESPAELWVLEVETGRARRLTGPILNRVSGLSPVWHPDGDRLVVAVLPEPLGEEPTAAAVPAGPVVRESSGRAAPNRTYQDLLADPSDEALFAHYMRAQLAEVDLAGALRPLGAPGLLWDFDISPDGRFLLVETLERPFSYLVPAERFPRRVEVWSLERDRETDPLVHTLARLPLREEVPVTFDSVPDGPREFSWRQDAPAAVVWAEALDGGDARREAEKRDRLLELAAPFDGEPRALVDLDLRYSYVAWGDDDLALVVSFWWRTRQVRYWALDPSPGSADAAAAPRLLMEYSFEDRYNHPGFPVTRPGRELLRIDPAPDGGRQIYLMGEGASTEGNRPFLDAFRLPANGEDEGKTTRLFRSAEPYYEEPMALLDAAGEDDGEALRLLTRREAVDQPANVFWRRIDGTGEGAQVSDAVPLTAFPHPTPDLAAIDKELIRYTREDGVELTGTLYLPEGWTREDGPLPTLLWAYPQEFKSADAAGQVTDSPYRFVTVPWHSPVVWTQRGYAVLDDPSMPIIGEGEVEPNDTYVEQLVSSAAAAVDELVRRGVAERGRLAIAGHSYGAFMAANLLAHSDLFATGIARSGAYNRSLTPFGFQAEERTFWEAPEVYFAMSPFMHVDKVNEPILLIHGAVDNNSGTFPMQSERFYEALKGLGATARLVMLPHESHGYRSRQSVLHVLWETDRWLERYLGEDRAKEEGMAEGDEDAP